MVAIVKGALWREALVVTLSVSGHRSENGAGLKN